MRAPAKPIPISGEVSPQARLMEALQCLVGLAEKTSSISSGGATDPSLEEILVDTEVSGCRYLLLRMPSPADEQVHLTPREQEIVRMVAKGHPNKVIADVLCISSWTVCTHLRRIFAKLSVGSRAAMVAKIAEREHVSSHAASLYSGRPIS